MTALVAVCLLGGPLRLQAEWAAPKQLPFARVHAVAQVGGASYLGGLRGLCRGRPGQWKQIDDRPVKEILAVGDELWVLYGDGSVDKLVPKEDRLYYDVLQGAVKRPWASCMALASRSTIQEHDPASGNPKSAIRNPKSSAPKPQSYVLFGGQGGWVQKSAGQVTETYPKELQGQVVTALMPVRDELWVGTQKNGLFRLSGGKWTRYGFGSGLPDLWITALTFSGGQLLVGVADGGLATYSNGRFAPFPCPAKNVRKLAVFRRRVVVGAMEGAWVQAGSGWQRLGEEETTALGSVDGRLLVGAPSRVLWWK